MSVSGGRSRAGRGGVRQGSVRSRSARQVLAGLTVPAAAVFVLLAVLTAVLQVPRWVLAVAAEVADLVVVAGQAAQDHLAGCPVVTTVPLRPHGAGSGGGVW